MNRKTRNILTAAFFIAAIECSTPALAENYSHCGDALEKAVWEKWETSAKPYINEKQINQRLLSNGDTYALYDIQTYVSNVVSLARRCKRTDRLLEIAQMTRAAFTILEPLQNNTGRAWICRGGLVCNNQNKLINTEVTLTSLQFLGLVSQLAAALSEEKNPDAKDFTKEATTIIAEHALRWSDPLETQKIIELQNKTASDVQNGSSSLFFTDKHLWMLTIYANFSEAVKGNKNVAESIFGGKSQFSLVQQHFKELLNLFNKRVTFINTQSFDEEYISSADIDRGFWRLYKDNQYAAYTDTKKPIDCTHEPAIESIDPKQVPIDQTIGWDFSHARRLVHMFNAFENNATHIAAVYNTDPRILPGTSTFKKFSNQLNSIMWNGDKDYPLFSNYWSGANGWFRAGYNNGATKCFEGYPPYGMSSSFPGGGYIEWGRWQPNLITLGYRLKTISESYTPNDSQFIHKYYAELENKNSSNDIFIISFWSSLILK